MGITQCFIKNGFCRICSCTVEETHTLTKEDPLKIRNVKSYADDLAKKDFRVTGVREECVFNQLSSFNIVNCPTADIIHDIFEGVCHSQLTKINVGRCSITESTRSTTKALIYKRNT